MLVLNIRRNQILKLLFGTITRFVKRKAYKSYQSNVTKLFTINEVVPDIIPVPPSKFVEIFYPSGAIVNAGNILTPSQVDKVPTVCFEALYTSYYLLYFSDPDSPSRETPSYREFHHWLVVNIPGNDVEKGVVLTDYLSPCPPRLSGKHRYVFLIYEQPYRIDFEVPRLSKRNTGGRELFSIRKFAQKHDLGDPVAGNLFLAEWDPHVDRINATL